MLKVLEDLLALQELDHDLAELRREIGDLPNRKAMAEERVNDRRKQLSEAEETYKKNAAAIRAVEMEIESLREQVDRLSRQQFEVKSNDQYRALQHEMAKHREAIRALEDGELARMEEGETQRAEIERIRAAMAEAERETAAEQEALEQRVAIVRRELEERERERAARAAAIPVEWVSQYERILKHHKDRAIVPVERQSCGGCHMKLPPQTIQDIRRKQTIVTCGFCGRLLYLSE